MQLGVFIGHSSRDASGDSHSGGWGICVEGSDVSCPPVLLFWCLCDVAMRGCWAMDIGVLLGR